ncbi:MAG: hypothetical protein DIZ77_04565 [endosymbiont of Seepiophila jonesi]|uniref:Uncharacterized protein n=1 Tax=endosymbiont of Lamellibrachia luymesi TaxID=2200907 RepID=A0A370DVD8_9GAMM|nr:MAG: hypothetical protein DIZ79_11865 [endosymbiont of Lamellibrachia luymesi]RDH93789.1 MAG: hypothetical protein DIZ77_04565 [endosymbiont of Seepiophila jonesi]
MGRQQIDDCVEQLCLKGCVAVRKEIKLLTQGVVLPEIRDLDEVARKELEAIMAVYGDACPIERESDGWQEKTTTTG